MFNTLKLTWHVRLNGISVEKTNYFFPDSVSAWRVYDAKGTIAEYVKYNPFQDRPKVVILRSNKTFENLVARYGTF